MNHPKSFYHRVKELTAQTPVAVATIVRVRGSAPREVGTKMIIHPQGQHYGTVGGGCGEGEIIQAGLEVIQTGWPRLVEVDLTEDLVMESSGVCGGIMSVYLERWSAAHDDD
jgi:xanthine dehydrogenase accessory factor